MAEIKIEKKKSAWWAWLLLVVVVLAVILYFMSTRTRDNDAAPATTAAPKDSSVTEFAQFVNSGRSMGLNHEYTNGALLLLTRAVQAKAKQINFNIEADLGKVKEHAEHITNDPFETTHANSIRSAADILAGVMLRMQQAKFPDLQTEAQDVQKAASAINPDVLTLDQRDAVKSFFEKSSQVLQKMS